jgi:hypothetical protein
MIKCSVYVEQAEIQKQCLANPYSSMEFDNAHGIRDAVYFPSIACCENGRHKGDCLVYEYYRQ